RNGFFCAITLSVLTIRAVDSHHDRCARRPAPAREPALLRSRDGGAQRRLGLSPDPRPAGAHAPAVPRDAGTVGALSPLADGPCGGDRPRAGDGLTPGQASRGAGPHRPRAARERRAAPRHHAHIHTPGASREGTRGPGQGRRVDGTLPGAAPAEPRGARTARRPSGLNDERSALQKLLLDLTAHDLPDHRLREFVDDDETTWRLVRSEHVLHERTYLFGVELGFAVQHDRRDDLFA